MPIAQIPVEKLEAFIRDHWQAAGDRIDTKKTEAERRRAAASTFYHQRQVYPRMEEDLPEKAFDILRFRQVLHEPPDPYKPFRPQHDEEHFERNINSFRAMQKAVNAALGV